MDNFIMTTQHVLVIGGSSGIGLATANLLAMQGYRVTIAGRDAEKLYRAQRDAPYPLDTVVVDATAHSQLPDVFADLGPLDHLILALGSGKGVGAFASLSVDEVRQGFEEKVFPHFNCAQAALPTLSATGSITFLSAITALTAMPGTSGIGAANAAIAGWVPTLAAEICPRRVNAVSPGVIDTPWWDFLDDHQKSGLFAEYAQKTPVRRVGSAQDVAEAIAFLVRNTFITGQNIVCDGGLSLGG
jgi:NAD(P)-dependent dehydrogenase (short-subunit alcohol dehydrogenase family)